MKKHTIILIACVVAAVALTLVISARLRAGTTFPDQRQEVAAPKGNDEQLRNLERRLVDAQVKIEALDARIVALEKVVGGDSEIQMLSEINRGLRSTIGRADKNAQDIERISRENVSLYGARRRHSTPSDQKSHV